MTSWKATKQKITDEEMEMLMAGVSEYEFDEF
jgi:hypothetical protein